MAKRTKADIEEARRTLLRIFKPGDTVFTITRRHSSTGMSRTMTILAFSPHGQEFSVLYPNWAVSMLTNYPLVRVDGNDAIRVGGTGFNASHHIADLLSYRLFGVGGKLRYVNL